MHVLLLRTYVKCVHFVVLSQVEPQLSICDTRIERIGLWKEQLDDCTCFVFLSNLKFKTSGSIKMKKNRFELLSLFLKNKIKDMFEYLRFGSNSSKFLPFRLFLIRLLLSPFKIKIIYYFFNS